MKNKTLAMWLTFFGGPLGLHRIYLNGRWDGVSALLCVPTLLGVYGVHRARTFGLDDAVSWVLIPLLGFTFAGCALLAITQGLSDTEKWNRRHNPQGPTDASAGNSNWLTIGGLVVALMLGTTVLLSSIAFSLQRFVEYNFDASQALDAPSRKTQP